MTTYYMGESKVLQMLEPCNMTTVANSNRKYGRKKWKMSFNINKCMVASVTLKQTLTPANYTLHGKQMSMQNT